MLNSPDLLKNNLEGKLQQTRIANLLRLSKGGIRRTAIHAIELSVIENVVDFRAEFQSEFFTQGRVLEKSHVPVIDGWIAAKRPWDIANLRQRAVRKNRWVEHVAVDPWIVRLESTGEVGLPGAFKSQRAPLKFLVVAVIDQDGESALIGVDSGNLPAVKRFACKTLHFSNGQFPDVVEYEAMPGIEQRRSISG